MWWFFVHIFVIFVLIFWWSSPLTLVVKLHKFTSKKISNVWLFVGKFLRASIKKIILTLLDEKQLEAFSKRWTYVISPLSDEIM